MKLAELYEISSYIRGITFKPADVVEAHSPESVVCMRTKNVQKDLDDSDLIAIPPEFVKRDEQYLREGDLLVSSANSWNLVGKTCFVPELSFKATAGGFISIVRPNQDKVESRYLYHWLSSDKTQHYVRLCGRQTTNISNLDRNRFLKLKLPLPPIEEQRRIAAILDKADGVRRKRKEAIALTEELLRSIFLDMFGDPVTNPKGWKIQQLEDFAEIQSGIAKGKKVDASQAVLVPYMRVANVQDGYVDLSEIKELRVRKTDAEKYALKKGDVLLTEGGDPDKLGRGAVWYGQIRSCIHQNHIFCVRPDYSVAEPEYLSAIIGSEYGKRYFLRAAKQTTGIATINKTQLKNFPALLPPIALQGKYVQTLEQIRRIRQRTEAKVNESDKLFNSLLQRAFRGEL